MGKRGSCRWLRHDYWPGRKTHTGCQTPGCDCGDLCGDFLMSSDHTRLRHHICQTSCWRLTGMDVEMDQPSPLGLRQPGHYAALYHSMVDLGMRANPVRAWNSVQTSRLR